MPPGSFIVKENYTADRVFDLVTLMYKVDGYDPDSNDWFWAKIKADGTIDAEGQVSGCQGCHRQGADNDYVLTGDLR